MRKSSLDINEIICQLERDDLEDGRVSFDCETGEVVVISTEVMKAVEEGDVDVIANLPEWKKNLVETAENVLFYQRERYIDVPEKLLHLVNRLMSEFAGFISDGALREKLGAAMEDEQALQNFEKALFEYPAENDRWRDFRDEVMRRELLAWLGSTGIGPFTEKR